MGIILEPCCPGYYPSRRRVTRALEFCVKAFVITIISFGWYTSFLQVGVGWLARHEGRYMLAAVYMTTVGLLFPLLAAVYLHACSDRATHSIPTYTAPEPQSVTEPFECRSDGSFDFCDKDNCKMRWKPPGTHHCSVCGVCRLGFDHHCPWLGNCLTTKRLKAFLVLLVLTSIIVPLASLPTLPMLRIHVIAALAASHADAWAKDVWWDRLYSWILCGGPLGRWVVGTLLGFRTLRTQRTPEPWFNGSLISQPHARVIVLLGISILLWLFAVSMIISVAADVTRGQTTLEGIRIAQTGKTSRISTGRFVCIPYSNRLVSSAGASAVHVIPPTQGDSSHESLKGQRIYPIPSSERVYDFGWRENWRRVLEQSLFEDGIPCRGVYEWPKLNPVMIRRILGFEGPSFETRENHI